MHVERFWDEANERMAKYDLLAHPFYQAWAAGQLTREDLCAYATDYYHHVEAFPAYLSGLHSRLPAGALRQTIARNLYEEEIDGQAHSDLWLEFAEGVGAEREQTRRHQPVPEIAALISFFRQITSSGPVAAALGALYAYESQVPKIAREKATHLGERYGLAPASYRYFTLHTTADVRHAAVWKHQIDLAIDDSPQSRGEALDGVERASRALWLALDGIERSRQERLAASPETGSKIAMERCSAM